MGICKVEPYDEKDLKNKKKPPPLPSKTNNQLEVPGLQLPRNKKEIQKSPRLEPISKEAPSSQNEKPLKSIGDDQYTEE